MDLSRIRDSHDLCILLLGNMMDFVIHLTVDSDVLEVLDSIEADEESNRAFDGLGLEAQDPEASQDSALPDPEAKWDDGADIESPDNNGQSVVSEKEDLAEFHDRASEYESTEEDEDGIFIRISCLSKMTAIARELIELGRLTMDGPNQTDQQFQALRDASVVRVVSAGR
jgi:hypothetical protein